MRLNEEVCVGGTEGTGRVVAVEQIGQVGGGAWLRRAL